MQVKAYIFDCVGPLLIRKKSVRFNKIEQEIFHLCSKVENEEIFWQGVKNKYGLNDVELDKIIKKIGGAVKINHPMWRFLQRVNKNHKTAIINNGTKTIFEIWKKKFNFEKNIDIIVNSASIGMRKPDARIYEYTCDLLKVKPSTCVFIDDDEENVETAIKLGMEGVLYDGAKS